MSLLERVLTKYTWLVSLRSSSVICAGFAAALTLFSCASMRVMHSARSAAKSSRSAAQPPSPSAAALAAAAHAPAAAHAAAGSGPAPSASAATKEGGGSSWLMHGASLVVGAAAVAICGPVLAALRALRRHCFVNYYGMQRFGENFARNDEVCRALLLGEYAMA